MVSYPFIQAASFTPVAAGEPRTVSLIVIHTMESAETDGTARSVAKWFAGQLGPAPRTSAHYCVDGLEVVQSVLERDVAWGASGANSRGIHIELAGRANQTAGQWVDEASWETLKRAARLAKDICRRHGIPIRRARAADIVAGRSGICGHVDVTKAYPEKGTHTDPGPHFPWSTFLDLVATA